MSRPPVQDLRDLLVAFSPLNSSMVAFLDVIYIIIMLAIIGNHMRSEYLVAMGLIDGIFGVQSINLGISFIVCMYLLAFFLLEI
jgi:hypothetical protein